MYRTKAYVSESKSLALLRKISSELTLIFPGPEFSLAKFFGHRILRRNNSALVSTWLTNREGMYGDS